MKKIIYLRRSGVQTANPLWALMFAIGVGMLMVAVTFIIFVNSSAYITVKQIQIGASKQIDLGPGYDVTSPVNAKDIDEFSAKVNARLNSINDAADFDTNKTSEKTLGL